MQHIATNIGTSPADVDRLRFRGRDTLTELLGEYSFTQAIYLAATGRTPDAVQTRLLDACLVLLLDHGITPSALVARLVADSLPTESQVAIAAGLLTIGDRFVGTIAGAGSILSTLPDGQADTAQWARAVVADYTSRRQRIPGFGHPHYTVEDPRAGRLFAIAAQAGVGGSYVAALRAIESEIARQGSRPLVLNATGAIAAVFSEIDIPVAAMRSLAVVSRSAGLLAHVAEEGQTHGAAQLAAHAQQFFAYQE